MTWAVIASIVYSLSILHIIMSDFGISRFNVTERLEILFDSRAGSFFFLVDIVLLVDVGEFVIINQFDRTYCINGRASVSRSDNSIFIVKKKKLLTKSRIEFIFHDFHLNANRTCYIYVFLSCGRVCM